MSRYSRESGSLKRDLGMWGAVMMGIGSIVGTGVFVSSGLAAGIAGPAVILAVVVAAVVATFNGLNSAQLAANHPVSGGTYEYGYRYLSPAFGFTAGWLFLLAKSASAATAALGFSGYLLNAVGLAGTSYLVPLALLGVAGITALVAGGIRRSTSANTVIVSLTLLTLAFFIVAGTVDAFPGGADNFSPFFDPGDEAEGTVSAVLYATALMFVAYTGYGRIATMGEEVAEPHTTIPRAMILTLVVTMVLYIGVALVGVAVLGASGMGEATDRNAAPLEAVARQFGISGAPQIMALGAVTAMLGVLLNLVLGLSRVLFAMGRRGDMPRLFGRLETGRATPVAATVAVGAVVGSLVVIGDVKVTWSFSAFTVLLYYGITNLAAWQLSAGERYYPKWIAGAGILSCLFLAFWVDVEIWLVGIGLILLGLVWHRVAGRDRKS